MREIHNNVLGFYTLYIKSRPGKGENFLIQVQSKVQISFGFIPLIAPSVVTFMLLRLTVFSRCAVAYCCAAGLLWKFGR